MTTNTLTMTKVSAKEKSPVIKIIQQIAFYLMLLGIFIFTLFPFYWAFNSSFKSEQELFNPASYIPTNFTTVNYESVFTNDAFLRSLLNSTFVSAVTVTLALVVGAFAAYALGRLEFSGRKIMMYLVLSMTLFPQISILSGLFVIVREAQVYGSTLSLIMTYPIFTLPFTIWVLTSFFQGLPAEIEQAAYVDGATSFQTFYLIMLPLTAPALVTTGLLAFISAWNEYLYALTFTLTAPASQTVPVAIALFSGKIARQEPIAEVMAAAMVVTFPLLILVLAFQNRIMAGLTAGAVKG
jgi:trehalose/maltose transport system permease protein